MNDFDMQAAIREVVGEKWFAEFTMPDGSKNGGLCSSSTLLPGFINNIRSMGGKNLVLTDKTIFFVDDDTE